MSTTKRRTTTPTGYTPKNKKHIGAKLKKWKEREKVKWSADENDFLWQFVTENGGKENTYWEACATNLNRKFSSKRTGLSCLSAYRRSSVNGVRKTTKTINAGVQTEISIGPCDHFAWGCLRVHIDEHTDNEPSTIPTEHTSLRAILSAETAEETFFHPETTSTPYKNKQTTLENNVNDTFENAPISITVGDHSYAAAQNLATSTISSLSEHSYARSYALEGKRKRQHKSREFEVHSQIANELMACKKKTSPYQLSLQDSVRLKVLLETRNISELTHGLLSVKDIKDEIMTNLCQSVAERPKYMKNRTHGKVSLLMLKDYDSLKKMNCGDIVKEMKTQFPEIVQLLISVMVPQDKETDHDKFTTIIPRLAMIYGIIMQTRNPELSLLQRIVSTCLVENISNQKVYDRLNRVGVALSYGRSLEVFKQVGSNFDDIILRAVNEKKLIRLIGDNINITVGVSQETRYRHKHMVHLFGSAALISDIHFVEKPTVPEIELKDLTVSDILLSSAEYQVVRKDCVKLIADVVQKYIPHFSFVKESVPESLAGPESGRFSSKTEIIPLPVLPYNEQNYQDVTKILDWYEALISKLESKMDPDGYLKFQIGGDQLTRERFSEALRLRIGNMDPKKRYSHLGPVTFEFFHLGMNYLEKVFFGVLWNKTGALEVGTLSCEKERIVRNSVDLDVKKAYEADKEFALSYVRAYIIEATMDFFGMKSRNDCPQKNAPPTFLNSDEQREWVYAKFGQLIDEYVFPSWSGKDRQEYVHEDPQTNYIDLVLANGSSAKIQTGRSLRQTLRKKKPDKVKDYGHCVLEVGMTFTYLLQLLKTPDRKRILGLFKMMLVLMKAKNNVAKYPLEILRMLVQQYSMFDQRQAHEVFYACFINTKGTIDSHVPADQQMEWLVKDYKDHIKHMYSNKTEANIETRSSALPGIAEIASNFDKNVGTVIRAKKHKKKDPDLDEIAIMDDLRTVRVFEHTEGRTYREFTNIPRSLVQNLDGYKFLSWFNSHKSKFSNID